MGLDISPCSFRCGDITFHELRRRIGLAIGIDIETFSEFSISKSELCIKGADHKVTFNSLQCLKNHPLYDLFEHSACDGTLTPKQCKNMIKSLDEAVNWIKLNVEKNSDLLGTNIDCENRLYKLAVEFVECIRYSINYNDILFFI